jgi:acyl carrier protein
LDLNDIRARLETFMHALYGADDSAHRSSEWILSDRAEGFDSVVVLRLVLAIEREFGIVIRDDEINPEAFGGLHNLSRLIERKLAFSSDSA